MLTQVTATDVPASAHSQEEGPSDYSAVTCKQRGTMVLYWQSSPTTSTSSRSQLRWKKLTCMRRCCLGLQQTRHVTVTCNPQHTAHNTTSTHTEQRAEPKQHTWHTGHTVTANRPHTTQPNPNSHDPSKSQSKHIRISRNAKRKTQTSHKHSCCNCTRETK